MKFKKELLLFLKEKIWYLLLLISSSIYVFHYRKDIYQLKDLNAVNLIFIIWIILLLLPLFSEIELFGVKLKKELEKTREEVKDKINNLQMLIMDLKVTNSNTNNINLNSYLPDNQKIKKLESVFSSHSSIINENEETSSIDENNMAPKSEFLSSNKFNISDEATYLFQVRLTLEKTLKDLCEKTDYVYNGYKSTNEMIRHLLRIELMEGNTADLINQIIKIADRGVHGEIVSKEYLNFINKVLPELQKQLNEVNINLHGFICPRCKRYVYSRYENVCPNCGFISDDD